MGEKESKNKKLNSNREGSHFLSNKQKTGSVLNRHPYADIFSLKDPLVRQHNSSVDIFTVQTR